jgi:hypothetical protein
LVGTAIVRSGRKRERTSHGTTFDEPTNDDRKSAIVTAKRRPGRFGDAPDLTPEEHRLCFGVQF